MFNASELPGLPRRLLTAAADIKPSNILIETPAINEMFQKAPPEAFQSDASPLDPPNDFYMESVQVTSAEEDVTCPADLSVRLADFGTGKPLLCPRKVFQTNVLAVACWVDKHLTEWIQPQMLRSPEVILGAEWNHKVDIWNLGIIASPLPYIPYTSSMMTFA